MRVTRVLSSLAAATAIIAADRAIAAGLTVQSQAAQQQEGFANSTLYNSGFGMTSGETNAPVSGSNRDANGNLVILNGVMSGGGVLSQQDTARQTNSGGGTGVGGATATAIGNNLNVTVTGVWNTVIIDSKQTNNGNQDAAASLNGQIKF